MLLGALLHRLVNANLLTAQEAAHVDGARVFLARRRLTLVEVGASTSSHGNVNDFREVTLAVALLLLLVQGLHCGDLLGRLSLDLAVHLVG